MSEQKNKEEKLMPLEEAMPILRENATLLEAEGHLENNLDWLRLADAMRSVLHTLTHTSRRRENQFRRILEGLGATFDRAGFVLSMPYGCQVCDNKTYCPCLIADEPCSKDCTCVTEVLSAGCLCCATYGGEQQQKDRANHLVAEARERNQEARKKCLGSSATTRRSSSTRSRSG